MENPDSILILKPSSLGDVVHTLPALCFLKKQYPKTHISWLINSEWSSLLEGNPYLDRIISFPRQRFRGLTGSLAFLKWAKQLALLEPDLVLDFQGLLRTGIIAKKTHAKKILGLSDAREGVALLYDAKADVSNIPHAVDRYLALAKLAGAATDGNISFQLPAGTPVALPSEPFIVLHPFARGEGKSLNNEEIRILAATLFPYPVVLVGRCTSDIDQLPSNVINQINQTDILQLLYILRHAAFTISVDSGPMHIAAGIHTNMVSIHLWSDPCKVGPYPKDCWIWKAGQLVRRKNYQPTKESFRPNFSNLHRIAALAHDIAVATHNEFRANH